MANPQFWNQYSYCGNKPLRYFDTDGRSFLIFIACAELLFVFDKNGNLVGVFPASNNLNPKARGHYPERRWKYLYHTHKKFESGFFGFNVPSDDPGSLGVHAGHSDWSYQTDGCIRTTEEAISVINKLHGENLADGLEFLIVIWDKDYKGIIFKIEFHLRGSSKDKDTIDKLMDKIEAWLQDRLGPLAFLYDYWFNSESPIPPQAF